MYTGHIQATRKGFPSCYGFRICHARVWLSYCRTISEYSMRGSWIMMFMLRGWEVNPWTKKSGIHLGFEPKTFWILVRSSLPLSHLDPWERRPLPDFISQLWRIWEWPGEARGAEDKLRKQHCLEASAEVQLILTLSRLNWTSLFMSAYCCLQ